MPAIGSREAIEARAIPGLCKLSNGPGMMGLVMFVWVVLKNRTIMGQACGNHS